MIINVVDHATGEQLDLDICPLCDHWTARPMRKPIAAGRAKRTCACRCHPRAASETAATETAAA